MTTPDYYSTRQVCRVLGVTRATLYNWGAEPDLKIPGGNAWTRSTIAVLATEHGRIPDWEAATA